MVNIDHMSKRIGKKVILEDINCQLENGVYGLLGPNGAGKTTLMRCMTELYRVSKGSIKIDGVRIKKKKEREIGYLPQSFGLFKELSVYDSMKYFCNLKGIHGKEMSEEIDKCLKAVYLSDKKKIAGGKLSGGMIRRAGVAQALLGHPKLLLFDEPTAGLDPEERMRFKNILSDWGKNETVVISTHIVEDIEACCDHVIIMDQGKICCIMTCNEIVQYASGKVFCCRKGEEEKIEGKYFLEKQYEEQGEIWYRILVSDAGCGLKASPPTLEDGYMCIIKGI